MENIEFQRFYKEPNSRYNVLSVVIFRLKDSYKNTNIYYNGLNNIINKFHRYLPNFYLRLYYDSSVTDNTDDNMVYDSNNKWKPLIERAIKTRNVQVVKYNIPKYKINEIYHEGLIGTIIRFYPFFDLPENKNIDMVITSDIDLSDFIFKKKRENYEMFKKLKLRFLSRISGCYNTGARFIKMKNYFDSKYPFNAGDIFTNYKFPIDLLYKFMNCVENNCDFYKVFLESIGKVSDARSTSYKHVFPYGIDELFCLVLKEHINEKKIRYGVTIIRDVAKITYFAYERFQKGLMTKEIFTKIISFLLGKLYNKDKDIGENFNTYDTIIYSAYGEPSKKYIYVFKRLQRMMRTIKKNSSFVKYGFEPEEADCVLEQSIKPSMIVTFN
jgi:hypothetical protein